MWGAASSMARRTLSREAYLSNITGSAWTSATRQVGRIALIRRCALHIFRRFLGFSLFFTLDGQGRTRFPAAKSQRWASSSSSVGDGPPSSSSSPAPIFARWKVLRSFSGAEIVSGEADEAGGLSPVNEENEAGCGFRPEKPYLPLSIEGIISRRAAGFNLISPTRPFQLPGRDGPFVKSKCTKKRK